MTRSSRSSHSSHSSHCHFADILDNQWKARHAVHDNDLADKLCDSLRTTLGHAPVIELSRRCMLGWLLPRILHVGGGRVDRDWTNINRNQAHVSVTLVLHREFKLILWGRAGGY